MVVVRPVDCSAIATLTYLGTTELSQDYTIRVAVGLVGMSPKRMHCSITLPCGIDASIGLPGPRAASAASASFVTCRDATGSYH